MRHALLVENDRGDAVRMAAILEARGFRVEVEAGDLSRIVGRAAEVDLVVLDVMLDGTDAFEVLRALAARRIDPPVLVTTGKFAGYLDFARSMAEGLGMTRIATLRKPFEATALAAAADGLARSEHRPAAAPRESAND